MVIDNETVTGLEQKSGKVSLEMLAKLTGFPVDLIKEEIFKGSDAEQVSLDDLRSAMLTYLDSTMLTQNEK